MNKKKILITSSSTKHSLVNSVYKNLKGLDIEILLGDTNPDAPSKYYGYNFLIMPKVPNEFEIIYKLFIDKISNLLNNLGININTVPVLDLRYKGSSNIIGDRSFSKDPKIVSIIGNICIKNFRKN